MPQAVPSIVNSPVLVVTADPSKSIPQAELVPLAMPLIRILPEPDDETLDELERQTPRDDVPVASEMPTMDKLPDALKTFEERIKIPLEELTPVEEFPVMLTSPWPVELIFVKVVTNIPREKSPVPEDSPLIARLPFVVVRHAPLA